MADMDQACVSRSTCPDRSPKDCRSHDWKTRCAWTHKLMSTRPHRPIGPYFACSLKTGPAVTLSSHQRASPPLISVIITYKPSQGLREHASFSTGRPSRPTRTGIRTTYLSHAGCELSSRTRENTRIPSECERKRSTTLTRPGLGIRETDLSVIAGTICTTKRRPKDRDKCNPHTQPAAEPRPQQAPSTRPVR